MLRICCLHSQEYSDESPKRSFLRNLPELLNLRLVGLEKVIGKCIRILSTIVFFVVSYHGHSTRNVDFTSDCADYP